MNVSELRERVEYTYPEQGTGLPEVPQGYFWRVTRPFDGYWYVKLRRKTWYGSRLIKSVISDKQLNARNILSDANLVLYMLQTKYGTDWWTFVEGKKYDRSLVGNYPPKTLNGGN